MTKAAWRDAGRLAVYGWSAGTVAVAVAVNLPAPPVVKLAAAAAISVGAGVVADPVIAWWRRIWRRWP